MLQYIECRFTKPEGLQLLRIYCSELAEVNYKTLYIGIWEKLRMMYNFFLVGNQYKGEKIWKLGEVG